MKVKDYLLKKYSVWIGGIPNDFTTLNEAQREAKKWINKGYNDVIIQIN